MDRSEHSMATLFAQLGLANGTDDINRFIGTHRGLSRHIALEQAPFWNIAQAQFLKEAIVQDSDWCEIVDNLDSLLRASN